MAKSKSSTKWLQEHFSDYYVQQAKKKFYRARSSFKLLEIDKKDQLLKPGMVVVDLGAAPGGWSQVVAEKLKGQGTIIASDILAMQAINGVTFVQGDFTDEILFQRIVQQLHNKKVDLVISDMAPNISGVKVADQAMAMSLAHVALEFSQTVLKHHGSFLVKVFSGEGYDEYLKNMRANFRTVLVRKPDASRSRSNETYLLGRSYQKE